MPQMPSESTFWSWAIRGLGGSCAILDGLGEHGPRMNDAQYAELQATSQRLTMLVGQLANRVQDRGATSHGLETDPIATRPVNSPGAPYDDYGSSIGDGGSGSADRGNSAVSDSAAGGRDAATD